MFSVNEPMASGTDRPESAEHAPTRIEDVSDDHFYIVSGAQQSARQDTGAVSLSIHSRRRNDVGLARNTNNSIVALDRDGTENGRTATKARHPIKAASTSIALRRSG
jgi:hypothetical protein